MSNAPFLRLFFSDMVGDTLYLSTEEFGAYLLLLGAMWNNGGVLAADDQRLARIARVSPKRWSRVWAAIGDFFQVDGAQLVQTRLLAEVQKADQISQKRRKSAKRGVEAKRLKRQGADQANGSANAKHPRTIDSEPTVLPPSGPPDRGSEAWDKAEDVFSQQGAMSRPRARTVFGKLLKETRLPAVELLPSLVRCEIEGTRDPVAYMRQAARGVADRLRERGGLQPETPEARVARWGPDEWGAAMRDFTDTGRWPDAWGPTPGAPGCQVPAEILAEHGFSAQVIPLRKAGG